jgi:hypothetical protein
MTNYFSAMATPELPPFQGEAFFWDIPRVETLG